MLLPPDGRDIPLVDLLLSSDLRTQAGNADLMAKNPVGELLSCLFMNAALLQRLITNHGRKLALFDNFCTVLLGLSRNSPLQGPSLLHSCMKSSASSQIPQQKSFCRLSDKLPACKATLDSKTCKFFKLSYYLTGPASTQAPFVSDAPKSAASPLTAPSPDAASPIKGQAGVRKVEPIAATSKPLEASLDSFRVREGQQPVEKVMHTAFGLDSDSSSFSRDAYDCTK